MMTTREANRSGPEKCQRKPTGAVEEGRQKKKRAEGQPQSKLPG